MADKAIMWKVDPVDVAQSRLEISALLHREAGKRGYSCSPKQSNIDKRYFAEINRHVCNPDGSYLHSHFNVRMGTGDTPLEAARDGYRQAVPLDDMMACLYLAIELMLTAQAAAKLRAREKAIEGIEMLIEDLGALLADSGRRFEWDDA